jgi:hypothetical protein
MEASLRPQPVVHRFHGKQPKSGGRVPVNCWLNLLLTLTHWRDIFPIDSLGTKWEQCSSYVPIEEAGMLKTFVEEAAALASITLFIGMIAVWAQLIPQI